MSEKAKNKTSSKEEYDKLGEEVKVAKDGVEELKKQLIELKKNNGKKEEIKELGKKLKEMLKDVDKLTKKWRKADPMKLHLSRSDFDQFLLRRFFFVPSNEIYGGTSGFYDYGPPACAIKNNLIAFWKRHFVLEEGMLEIDCATITPSVVFEASEHVKRFFDYMVRDEKTKECFRVDKLIEDFVEATLEDPTTKNELAEELKELLKTLENLDGEGFDGVVEKYNILSPSRNKLSKSFPFNLMFKTTIGPIGSNVGYLRPETAQGIFTNFKRLYEYNYYKLPFAVAQVGKSYRNEISPKSGILRCREFSQCEIEHFMDPNEKTTHEKFENVENLKLILFGAKEQMGGVEPLNITLKQAFDEGIIKNKTLAYYIGRVYLFFERMGILPEGMRFRQHLPTEMAHYAADCWDLEILTSYGWYEVVGLADRECFDLVKHQEVSEKDLCAREVLKEPITTKSLKADVLKKEKKNFFKKMKRDGKKVLDYLNEDESRVKNLQKEFEGKDKATIDIAGTAFELEKAHFEFVEEVKKVSERKFVPGVIEPSFGVDRMLYCLLEHSFWIREDPEGKNKIARSVLSLVPFMAPYKVAVVTVIPDSKFNPIIKSIVADLAYNSISYKVDGGSTQIGRKYARLDDVGIPFIVTIDGETLEDKTITLRERDSCTQVRIPMEKVCETVQDLIDEKLSWEDVRSNFKEQKETASEKVGKKEKN